MKIRKWDQIGVVVKDVERTARFLEERLGIGPVAILELNDCHAKYRGQEVDYKLKLGLTGIGDVALELIEVKDGDPILRDFLPPSGQGVHHLGVYVDDLESAVREWQEAGGKLLQRGSFMKGGGSAYLDTPENIGILVELIQFPKPEEKK
jgi:methylmalonyl-CoA/ethylmalonyl-CoA epimerase